MQEYDKYSAEGLPTHSWQPKIMNIIIILTTVNLLTTYIMVSTLKGDGEYYSIYYMDIKNGTYKGFNLFKMFP